MAIIKYKLTDQNILTHNEFQWELGVWYEATGSSDQDLCTDGWLHCCDSPLLAVLHNPIHAKINDPRLWEVECEGESKDNNGIQCGYRRMRLVKELPLPQITIEQFIRYAILCVKLVYSDAIWNRWADKWLSNEDRTKNAALATHAAADIVAYVAGAATSLSTLNIAMYLAADAAARAAYAAYAAVCGTEDAEDAAVYVAEALYLAANAAARAACVVDAAVSLADAAYVAEDAAAHRAARAVLRVVKPLNLIELAEQATEGKF